MRMTRIVERTPQPDAQMKKAQLIQTAAVLLAIPTLLSAKTNPFERGWCTYQAAETFNRIAPEPGVEWRGNAVNWLANASVKGWATTTRISEIVPGSALVWSSNIQSAGHVAGVTQVTATSLIVEEMNYGARDPRANDPLKTINFNKRTTREFKIAGSHSSLDGSTLRFIGAILPWKTDQWHLTQARRDLNPTVGNNDLGTLSANPTEVSRSLRAGWTIRSFEAVKVRVVLGLRIRTTTQVQHAVSHANLNVREVRWKRSLFRWSEWATAR